MWHCPAASPQNSQACHQSTACPKQDAVLQQTFQLDALLSITVEGKLITSSLFIIPCFEILQGSIPFLMPSTVLGEGGSTRKTTWVALARQLAVVPSRRTSQSSDCMTIKAGRALHTDRHEQCPRALGTPALTVTLLQVLYTRQIEAHWNTTAAAAPCSTIPLPGQDSQQARWPSSG